MAKKQFKLSSAEKVAESFGMMKVIHCSEEVRKAFVEVRKQLDPLTKQREECDAKAEKIKADWWKSLKKLVPEYAEAKKDAAHYDHEFNVLKVFVEPLAVKELLRAEKRKKASK